MNSYERVFNRMEGKETDRLPNFSIVMMFAAKLIGVSYGEYLSDYHLLAEGAFRCHEMFGIDCLSAISDPMREAEGLGTKVIMLPDAIPYAPIRRIQTLADIDTLKVVDPASSRRMNDRLEAVRLMKERGGRDVPVLGWVEGAMAESCDLMNMEQFFTSLFDEPEEMVHLMQICMEQNLLFAKAQVQAGADIIGVGDAASSLIGHELYEEFALPFQQKMIQEIHGYGAKVKLHICGNIGPVLDLVGQTGADMIDIDSMVDLNKAAEILPEQMCIAGNMSPVEVMYKGNPDLIRSEVIRCAEIRDRNRSFIAPGCEIPRDTSFENMYALQKAIQEL